MTDNIIQIVISIGTFLTAIFAFIAIISSNKEKQEVNRANVIAYYMNHDKIIYLVIKNIGRTEAYDVKISSEDNLKIEGKKFDAVINRELKIMPANFRIVAYLANGSSYDKINPKTYEIKIEFTDIYNKRHARPYKINLDMVKNVTFMGDSIDTLEDGLNSLKNEISMKIK